MAIGTVKWFSNIKGYGFVNTEEDESIDIFAHFSEIEMDGYKKLNPGHKVQFDLDEGPKGWQAKHIRPVDDWRQSDWTDC